MIRMLLSLLVISLALYLLVFRQTSGDKPEVIYQKNLDDAKAVEEMLLEQADKRMERIDEQAR